MQYCRTVHCTTVQWVTILKCYNTTVVQCSALQCNAVKLWCSVDGDHCHPSAKPALAGVRLQPQHCTLIKTSHFKLCTTYCILHSVYYSLYTLHFTPYTFHFILSLYTITMQCVMYNVHCILYTIHCKLYIEQCICVYCILYTIHCPLYMQCRHHITPWQMSRLPIG